MIDVTGLELDRAARRIQHPGGNPIRAQAVDHRAVAALPQEAADPERRAHKQEVIQLVEIPFVVEEEVKHPATGGEFARLFGVQDVIEISHSEAEYGDHQRPKLDPK